MKSGTCVYVALNGNDNNPGTEAQPLATFENACQVVRKLRKEQESPITVFVRGGTYYLENTLEFVSADSGTPLAPVTYSAYPGELVTISGGRKLDCKWQPFRDGMWMCKLPAGKDDTLDFTQLFINDKRQIRARFPNHDDSAPKEFSGYIRAAGKVSDEIQDPNPGPDDDMTFSGGAPRGVIFDPATFTQKRWGKPGEAVIHIFQAYHWGNLQWRVKQIDWDQHIIWFGDGGQQMGVKYIASPCEVDQRSQFYIENVFEELDAPGEWYLDRAEGVLYFMPPTGMELETALVEVPILQQAMRLTGTQANPIHDMTLKGFRFAHTASTFLEPYTIPSKSDWSIHRGGAIYMDGARNCSIEECFFDAVGGNAVFINNFNRGNSVKGCKFTETGDSAICFVGSLDNTVGTQRNFPYDCRAENNLIHDCGIFGKQIAGIYISRAKRITAVHNEVYNMPRAGICIGDGTWGGHLIEHNYIHDTCRETGDHGPFNAWGRDMYWCLTQSHEAYTSGHSHEAGQVLIDAMEPVVLRHNFFKESNGWGIDLDDGASNYDIYSNLCVGISIKLREGAYRTIHNNIFVNGANSPCFHVGNEDNHDRYFCNITVMATDKMKAEMDLNFKMGKGYGEIYTLIAPPARGPWLEEIDHNCFFSDLGEFIARVQDRGEGKNWIYQQTGGRKLSLSEWQALGFDLHSVFADPLFVDAKQGDYRVKPASPALKLGFVNFDMDKFGLTKDFPVKWRER